MWMAITGLAVLVALGAAAAWGVAYDRHHRGHRAAPQSLIARTRRVIYRSDAVVGRGAHAGAGRAS
jgi:hypothetical protein